METKSTKEREVYAGICSVKESYESPRIEVVEISIEKGFADSSYDFGDDVW